MDKQTTKIFVLVGIFALVGWTLLSVLLFARWTAGPELKIAVGVAWGALTILGSAYLLIWLIGRYTDDLRSKQTSLIESLELIDLTLSTLEESVLMLDPETGAITRCNATTEKMFGYIPAELIGQSTRLLHVDDEDFSRFEKEMKITTGNMGFFKFECVMKRKSGERFPAELFLRPKKRQGELFCVVYVIRDLTEKKWLEEEVGRIQRLESLGILAGGIAHDFNNMLTAILGNISLAKMQLKTSDKAFAMLTDSEEAVLKARALTHRLLTFTKGEQPVRRVINLSESLRQMVDLTLRGSKVKGLVRLAPDLWPVEVDEGQIGQVVNNLVINAVHAMPQGGTLEIDAENFIVESSRIFSLNEGRYVKVAVRDTGTGISPENLPKIFTPYFTTKPDGSGLGLATSYSIIHKHGGRIEVESRLEYGSVFTIYLPARGGKTKRSYAVPEMLDQGTGRILVVDDEASVRKVASEMIQTLGYQVVCAENGDTAVDIFRRAAEGKVPFDAVLLDLTIPGEPGGKETVRRLHEMNGQAKVIVTSGYPDDPVMVNFRDYGFSKAIAKPYTSVELSRVLHQVIAGTAQP